MLIPLQVESAEDFLTRAALAIVDPGTQIYVDTSLAMWLTVVGPASRAAFIDWSSTVPGRIHVPAWTLQEYYRHHRAKTLKTDIDNQCLAVVRAAAEFRSELRLLADGSLLPGKPEAAFLSRIDRVQDELRALCVAAKAWDYDEASGEIIDWMNRHALTKTGIFARFTRLHETGSSRYAHEVPPGYQDCHKSINRYGDLLFWQDVVADARRRGAARVILLTRDRKEDWYDSLAEPDVGPALRRLRSRWEPVPSPHPMLAFEMGMHSGCELMLLDDLYLGAVLWRVDKVRYGRFAAVALSMGAEQLSKELAPPPLVRVRAVTRQAEDRITASQALALVRGALEQGPDENTLGILTALAGDAPVAEQTVDLLTPDWVGAQESAQLASFSRRIYDMADPAQPFAKSAATRLLDAVDQIDAEHASAVIGGMVAAAFYENATPRNRPGGVLLQDVYAWAIDPGCQRVLKVLANRLKLQQSAAIVLPDDIATPLNLRLAASDVVATVPPTLGQIFVGAQAVLTVQAVGDETLLRTLLAERAAATVAEIVEAVSRYYGIPMSTLITTGTADYEIWNVAETAGLERFGTVSQPVRGNSAPSENWDSPAPDLLTEPSENAESGADDDDDDGFDEEDEE